MQVLLLGTLRLRPLSPAPFTLLCRAHCIPPHRFQSSVTCSAREGAEGTTRPRAGAWQAVAVSKTFINLSYSQIHEINGQRPHMRFRAARAQGPGTPDFVSLAF